MQKGIGIAFSVVLFSSTLGFGQTPTKDSPPASPFGSLLPPTSSRAAEPTPIGDATPASPFGSLLPTANSHADELAPSKQATTESPLGSLLPPPASRAGEVTPLKDATTASPLGSLSPSSDSRVGELTAGKPSVSFDQNPDRAGSLWLSADYLLWWVRRGPTGGPLVTTGSLNDFVPGALGQPNTRVLFGDQSISYGALSGLRVGGGMQLNSLFGLEANYFVLPSQSVHYNFASNAAGSPLIGRPIFNNQTGLQDDYATSNPGVWAGNAAIASSTSLQGFDLNLSANLLSYEKSKLDMLIGFRGLYLSEDLSIRDTVTPIVPGGLSFLGGAIDPPSSLADLDRFHTGNNFYGGQLGLHWQGVQGPLALDLTGKIALGTNQQVVTIDGSTTLNSPGAASVTAPGGLLAQTTNIGRHYQSAFSAVPEIGVNLSYQLTPRLKAMVGYNFLYWSNVVRPGNQIDHNVNPALPPGDQDFGNGLGQSRPAFSFRTTDFSAQGVKLGLEFRF